MSHSSTLRTMVGIYCRSHHKSAEGRELCPECENLVMYAMERLKRCPHGKQKPSCKRCAIHCYSASHRERIRRVMRYSGPRMIYRHPLAALRHLLGR